LILVLESEALAVDVDDDRVAQDPIEHRRSAVAAPSSIAYYFLLGFYFVTKPKARIEEAVHQ
jgi:hypothetical protein